MDLWNFSERHAALVRKLHELRQQGRLQPAALAQIEQLYAEGRVFAAERLAGLAIWAGAGSAETLATMFEQVGSLLRALGAVATAVATADALHVWTEVGMSRDAFPRHCGLAEPRFYYRLLQVHGHLAPEVPATVVERGREVRRIVGYLAGQRDLPPQRGDPPPGVIVAAPVILHTLDTAATQAADALLMVGRHLWQVRLWEDWKTVAPSHEAFLEEWLGVGTALGVRLSAVWESFADLAPYRRPLRRLELLITLAAGARGETKPPPRKDVRHGAR